MVSIVPALYLCTDHLMMLIAPNPLARWKEGVQGEEEAGDQTKGAQKGTDPYSFPCKLK